MLSRTYLKVLCVAERVGLLPYLALISISVRRFHKVAFKLLLHLLLQSSLTIGALVFALPDELHIPFWARICKAFYPVEWHAMTEYLLVSRSLEEEIRGRGTCGRGTRERETRCTIS
jgi:hypothetical protein